MVTALTEAEVKVIGFDAIFAEEDTFDTTCTRIFSDIARGLGKAEDESLKRYVDPGIRVRRPMTFVSARR